MKRNILAALFTSTLIFSSLGTAAVGPKASDAYDDETGQLQRFKSVAQDAKLNVIIPVFDPNLPSNPADYGKDGVWPELRFTEAKMFAVRLQQALDDTRMFGSVKVAPNDSAIGELYVMGKILKSTGEEIELEITVQDISGTNWLRRPKKFAYQISEYEFDSLRNQNGDHYAKMYRQIANDLVSTMSSRSDNQLRDLRKISSLVLARSYSNETFGQYFKKTRPNKPVKLSGYPDVEDPQFTRTQQLRTREEIFVDDLQSHYLQFVADTQASYRVWQQDSFTEARNYRLAQEELGSKRVSSAAKALWKYARQNDRQQEYTRNQLRAQAERLVENGLDYSAFKNGRESKYHADRLNEHGRSADAALTPKNVDFEGKIERVTGTAAQQFQTFRNFLQKVYEEEATPDRQL